MMPGAPKPGGVLIVTAPSGAVTEMHTFTCRHCGLPQVVPVGKKIEDCAETCYTCWGLVCPDCVRLNQCTPFMKQAEEMEAGIRRHFAREALYAESRR